MTDDFNTRDFQQFLEEKHILLAVQGIMTQDLLALLGMTLRRSVPDEVLARRLFGIVIELAQNIHHYSADKEFFTDEDRQVGKGIIAISKEEDTGDYVVHSGNLVELPAEESLRKKIEHVNKLDKDGLKKLYKELRRAEKGEHHGGSVGFVDMARKSGHKLEFDFFPSEEKKPFFVLGVRFSL